MPNLLRTVQIWRFGIFIPPALLLILIGTMLILSQRSVIAAEVYLLLLLLGTLLLWPIAKATRTHKKTLLAIITSLSLTVLLPYFFDTVIRLSDSGQLMPPDGLIDDTLYTWGHKVINNSDGFREREIISPKPPNTYRVMLLGDSMSWGVGLPVDQRYSNVLEKYLNASVPDKNFEVLNFSYGGGNTLNQLEVMREYIDVAQPDQVVIGFYYNDIDISAITIDPEAKYFQAQFDRLAAPYLSKARLHYLSSTLSRAMNQGLRRVDIIPSQEIEMNREFQARQSNLPKFKQTLQEIKNVSDARGLPSPILMNIDRGLYTDRPTDFVHPNTALQLIIKQQTIAESIASSIGFVTYNHRQEISNQLSDQIITINSLDHHPSAALHEIFAAKLRDAVLTNMVSDNKHVLN